MASSSVEADEEHHRFRGCAREKGGCGYGPVSPHDVEDADQAPLAGSAGIRPVVVVSHHRYAVIPGLFLAVPLTSRNRGLDHHIEVPADDRTGLKQVSFAMTEQVRAMSEQRAGRQLGKVSSETLTAISRYLHLFIA